MSEGCVVLITKDRPATLAKTLHNLENSNFNVVIIDDSTTTETYNLICDNYKSRNITYHGRNEQDALLMRFKNSELDAFVRPLGSKGWNLGFVRNYALVVSKSLVSRYTKILFMDDDIIVREPDRINQLFFQVNSSHFVGAKINGMADDSVVGHLMRACGGAFYEFLAGGFLAFNINTVSEYFLNYYNEDQIWLFLHSPETRFETYCEVEQQQYNPFESAVTKALHQEFGEILEEGAEEAFRCGNHGLLLKEVFWKEICDARIKFLDQLPALLPGNKIAHIGQNVYQALTDYHSRISHDSFVNTFHRYFLRRERWRAVLEAI